MEDSFVQLGDFTEDSRVLDAPGFASKWGEAFLVHHGGSSTLSGPRPRDKTMNLEMPTTDPKMTFNPRSDFLVFPLRAQQTGDPGEEVISIGRNDTNDIVISDASVSGIHAFVTRKGPGEYHLQDMNSTNGTSINGVPAPEQGGGDPAPLKSGDRIRMGAVKFTFLQLEEFRTLATNFL